MESTFKQRLLKSLCAAGMGILLSASAGIAQGDWQAIYNSDNGNAAARGGVLHFSDGSSIAVGETMNANQDVYVVHQPGGSCWASDWQKRYDIGGNDIPRKIRRTTDGGYVIVGTTENTRNECSGSPRNDIFILKITSNGTVQWVRTYGDGLSDEGWDIQQLSDGGYIVAGSTRNYGTGGQDAYLLKLLADGSINWGRCYGGANDDYFLSCEVMANGEVLAAGGTASNTAGGTDYFMVRVTTTLGNPVAGFPASYGSSANEGAARAIECADGSLAVVGYTRSFGGNSEGYILRTTAAGVVTNGHYYGGGGSGWDELRDITQLSGGDLMVTGLYFNPGNGFGNYDVYVGRVNSATLAPVSQLIFGGNDDDQGWAITRSGSGNANGWMVAGYTRSYYFGSPMQMYVISRPDMTLRNCLDRVPTITHAQQLLTRTVQPQATLLWYRYCPTPVDTYNEADWIYLCGDCPATTLAPVSGDRISEYRGPGFHATISPALDTNNLSVASVDESGDASAALYPNPVKSGNSFSINLPAGSSRADITISDMSGKVVYTGTADADAITIDTDGWGTGVYAVRLKRGEATVTKRIVVTD